MSDSIRFADLSVRHTLGTDALGFSLSAERAAAGASVPVYVRAFHGPGIDPSALWRAACERAAAVRAAVPAAEAELGRDAGIPYLAYPGRSGRDLASVLAAARTRDLPVAADQALTVIGEIARQAAGTRPAAGSGEPCVHGLIVPHLVLIDDSGAVHLLGFEVGPALARQCAGGPQAAVLAPYLSPELRAGTAIEPTPADDVYAIGALLAELITGRSPDSDLAAVLDRLRLVDGEPIPDAWLDLMQRSLAPGAGRIPDLAAWSAEFEKLAFDHYFRAAPRSLAALVGGLFDRPPEPAGSPEIEATTPASRTPEAGPPTTSPQEVVSAADLFADDDPSEAGTEPTPARSGFQESAPTHRWWVAAAIVVAALVGAGVYAAVFGFGGIGLGMAPIPEPPASGSGDPQPPLGPAGDGPAVVPAKAAPPVETAGAVPSAPAAAQGGAADAVPAADAVDRPRNETGPPASVPGGAAGLQRTAGPRSSAAEAAAGRPRAPAPPVRSPPPRPQDPATAGPAAGRGTAPARVRSSTSPGAVADARAESPPEDARPAPNPDEDPAAERPVAAAPGQAGGQPELPRLDLPEVWVGELVEPGPGVTPPRLRWLPEARLPRAARGGESAPVVEVRVLVGENGRPLEVATSGERIARGVEEAAARTAREAVFDAARKEGVAVRMWTTVEVRFEE